MKINHLVLASTSSHRMALLEQLGIHSRALAPQIDEQAIHAATPSELAAARSLGKGLSLAFAGENFVAIAADQVLACDGQAFGKAKDRATARDRLRFFAGKVHSLHSAFSLVAYTGSTPRLLGSRVVNAKMHMRPLDETSIEAYLDTGEWEGCAGCYQYENRGMHLFSRMEGDLSTVIGLPLPALLEDLRNLGIDLLLNPKGPWTLRL